jgi:hypothetical protein
MGEVYYAMCQECEYVYHCFGKEVGRQIQNNGTDDLELSSYYCKDFYPKQKQ